MPDIGSTVNQHHITINPFIDSIMISHLPRCTLLRGGWLYSPHRHPPKFTGCTCNQAMEHVPLHCARSYTQAYTALQCSAEVPHIHNKLACSSLQAVTRCFNHLFIASAKHVEGLQQVKAAVQQGQDQPWQEMMSQQHGSTSAGTSLPVSAGNMQRAYQDTDIQPWIQQLGLMPMQRLCKYEPYRCASCSVYATHQQDKQDSQKVRITGTPALL